MGGVASIIESTVTQETIVNPNNGTIAQEGKSTETKDTEVSMNFVLPIHINNLEFGLKVPVLGDGSVSLSYAKLYRQGVGQYDLEADDLRIERIYVGRATSPTDEFNSEQSDLLRARSIYNWMLSIDPTNSRAMSGKQKIASEMMKQNMSIWEKSRDISQIVSKFNTFGLPLDNPSALLKIAEDKYKADVADRNLLEIAHLYKLVYDAAEPNSRLARNSKNRFLRTASEAAAVF